MSAGDKNADGVARVLGLFERSRDMLTVLVAPLTDDAPAVIEATAAELETLAPTLAYLDAPRGAMANALFFCAIHLAVFKTLRKQGVSEHAYGAAMLEGLARVPQNAGNEPPPDADWAEGPGTHPGEFVVEPVAGSAPGAWGYNIKFAPSVIFTASTTPWIWCPTCAPATTW